MIEITVRTLDSQNHKFSVEEEFTVQQFKQHIAGTVNIPAETQRIIYSGRVLTDDSKLSDLGVNGKVVHLVERPPPSDNQTNDQPNTGNATGHAHPHQQRVLGGNAMYLGSMAIPFDHANLVPPPTTHRLAASRLAVARRMLRRAEAIIAVLENPSTTHAPRTQNDEVQVEVTPVFEARVVVPVSSRGDIDANLMDAVQSTLLQNAAANIPTEASINQAPQAVPPEGGEPEGTQSATSTPEPSSTPLSTSTEDIAGQAANANQGGNASSQENVSRTSEMADLFDTLGALQTRLAPFLERYRTFLRDDPEVGAGGGARAMERTFNHVSEVLHFFSHAYHLLSDITLRVRSAPPRRLVCRPILIQQTAVVPAGFPIQVEAQINFSSDMPIPNSMSSATQTPPNTANTTTAGSNATPTANVNAGSGVNRTSRVTIPHFEFMNIPALPPGAVHVQSIPIGIHTMRSSSQTRAQDPGNQNATESDATNATNAQPISGNVNAPDGSGNLNNSNVEFFMEVTPESITIDSLEAPLADGSMRNVTQEMVDELRSFMQVNRLANRGASTSSTTESPRHPPATISTTSSDAAATTAQTTGQGSAGPGQNSQARGNTQTHPTTATHTRSTSRPHVHFAQHAIQGFDPFLPCNSHHIMHLRSRTARLPATNNNQNQPNNNNVRSQNGNNPPIQISPMLNLVRGLMETLQNVHARRAFHGAPVSGAPPAPPTTVASGRVATGGGTTTRPAEHAQNLLYSSLQNFMTTQNAGTTSDSNSRGPTIAQLVQEAGDELEGEGLFGDLFRLLGQHLSMGDLLQLSTGRLDSLLRMRNEIRTFVIDQVLEGYSPTPQNVERAVDKLLNEVQPFIASLAPLPVRDDIDIVRSTQVLLRNRLPNVINLAVSRRPNSMKALIDQLRLIGRHLFALLLHASSTGVQGVEEVVSRIAASHISGLSPSLEQWSLLATRVHLHEFLLSVDIPSSVLQPYIVRNVNSILASSSESGENEPMEVDGEEAKTEEDPESNVLGVLDLELNDADDGAGAVVIGSESWHGQVPPEWVPVIAKDTQRQRRQSQAPLSDGYLSGMPSKRRKVVTGEKPQGTLPQVITESIRRAVTTTGNASAANLDAIAEEGGSDLTIQSAYRDLLRTSVQSRIQDNEDFTPERFPNASSYFSKSQRD